MNDKIRIPLNKPFLEGKELSYIRQAVVENGHASGGGPFTKKCEEWLENHLGCPKALLTHSCTAALEISAILADIRPGDEIVMPSYTFVSTANAFVLRGGVPVFVDIRPDTLNMNENLIEAALTPLTRAIVPVHYAGIPCAMDPIMDVARQHHLMVIEDAAQSMMTDCKGRRPGAIGHFGACSFHETKSIISGEGGALIVNDKKYIERAETIRDKGTNRSKFFRGELSEYTWVDVGSSYLPSEITAAYLYAQMENAQEIAAKRNRICRWYMESLTPLAQRGFFQLPRVDDQGGVNVFYIVSRSLKERTDLALFLRQRGILAVFHYIPLHSSPAGKIFGRVSGTMDVTDSISRCLLRLPLYYEMTEENVGCIVEGIFDFYNKL